LLSLSQNKEWLVHTKRKQRDVIKENKQNKINKTFTLFEIALLRNMFYRLPSSPVLFFSIFIKLFFVLMVLYVLNRQYDELMMIFVVALLVIEQEQLKLMMFEIELVVVEIMSERYLL
jgi:hypothetical protein